ncbi:DUF2156 domain-containing protein [bacterium]|nr:MAG: DUF2156 domain-containing protein [bacterium]
MREETDRDLARRLVRQYGWNSTCTQTLNPGLSLWVSEGRDAAVAYVRRRGVAVVAGAPVCAETRLPDVMREFERAFPRVAYFGAEARVLHATETLGGYERVALGAQPIWSPASFGIAVRRDRSLRAQLARARNKGVVVIERTSGQDPGLRRVLDQWLRSRRFPTLRFLVEPETLDLDGDRRLFVAEREGRPVGFVVMAPVPQRNGWLTEMFVRGDDAPNGTVELTLDAAIAACGGTYVTMGIVPLARQGGATGGPGWLSPLIVWARAHGRRFYDFEGLEWFKAKFGPDHWEPIWLVSREERLSLRTLIAVAEAFVHGPLLSALVRGVLWSLRREWSNLRRKRV